jgi:hypothetical protein
MKMADDRPITGSGALDSIMIKLPKKADPDGKAKTFTINVNNKLDNPTEPDPFTTLSLNGVELTSMRNGKFTFKLLPDWFMEIK